MTKAQCIQNLQAAEQKCGQYLSLKLQAGDYRGASAVLLEMAEIKAQMAALSAEFVQETKTTQS
jgi:hypothetical protein